MKKLSSILWGIALIVLGVLVALNTFEIMDIDIFFDGWWTLFIIIPCVIGLFTENDKTGNLIGLASGVFLLLCCQDVLGFDMLWKLLIPAIIVIIGLKMVLNGIFGNKKAVAKGDVKNLKNGCAVFSGCNINLDGEQFDGARLSAVFGGVDCDLRNAVIEEDCVIHAFTAFGGIDIFLPDNVNVKVNSNAIFGGVSNEITNRDENSVTVYISGIALFGGIDIGTIKK